MSASFSLRFSVGVAALSCLMLGYAGAQQGTSGNSQSGSSGSGSSASDASGSGAGQSGRSSAAQSGQGSSQQSGQSARSQTANYGATASASGSSSEVERFMTNCLLAQNESEVQLTELAQQQSQNSSVKEFAQKMAQDHRQLIQQLQQIAGTQGSRSSSISSGQSGTSGTADTTTSTRTDTTRTGTSGLSTTGRRDSKVSEVDLPSTPGANNTTNDTSSSALPGSSGASGTTSSSGRSSLSSSQTTDLAGGVASASSGGAVQQLMQLDRQINDRKTQMVREELQQKQGAEFDKAFVGSAIPAHIHMIAELEVLEKQGQGQLAQIAQQARPIAQQHLEHAKQLMRQLDNQSGGGSTAERSSSRRER